MRTSTTRGFVGRRTALALVLVSLPLPALAQDPTARGVDGSVEAPAPAAQVERADPRWEEARVVIARGEALFAEGNFAAALAEFQSALPMLAGHPRQHVVLYNLALCHERLFNYDRAIQQYEAYLRAAGPSAEDRALVTNLLTSLRGLLATLQIDVNVPAEVWVDSRPMGWVPNTLTIPAGRHSVEVRAHLHESARHEVQLSAGSFRRLDVHLDALSSYRGLRPGYFYGSVVLTAAAGATAIVLGTQTLAERDQGLARAQSTMQLRTAELEQQQQRIRDWSVGTDVAIGATVLFGAVSVLLYFLTDWEAPEHRTSESGPSLRVDRNALVLAVSAP